MKIYKDVIQGSDEWYALRCGKFTASDFSKLFMGKSAAGYNNLINEKVFQIISGEVDRDGFVSDWMRYGSEMEPLARKQFERANFQKVEQVGFIEMDEFVGCSPDGLINDDGLIEIKCPKHTTLINYHLIGKYDIDYFYQMQGQMYVTGRNYCVFYAWHPKIKPFESLVFRDEKIIASLHGELGIATREVKKRINQIMG